MNNDLLAYVSMSQSIVPVFPISKSPVVPNVLILPVKDSSNPKESLSESDVGVPVYVSQNLSQLHSTITQLYDLPTVIPRI